LARRPDLGAAEARLRASLADADAARLNLYPRLPLTGSFGGNNEELSRVLANPVASLGAGLVLPFIDWRQLRRQAAISEADYQIAVLTFRQSLYQALSEVETCLSAAKKLKKQGEQLGVMLDAARRSEALYETRYLAGAVPLQSWLDAQERRRQAEISLIENRLAQLLNQTDLAKALGGGVPQQAQDARGGDW
ncbi:MAG TPA: RND transporter, partial [Desulfobulbaceae bacterium]|nr:RND transporter [Desulfobulbaceae bacterium]